MTPALPRFGIDDYAQLLAGLRNAGCSLAPVTEMLDPPPGRVAFLRHDVDLDPPSTLPMAEREADLGVRATYYIPLTQHWNALSEINRRAIRRLVELGHEIGLHYDMRTYPADEAAARDHLEWELATLSRTAGTAVRTLCMHQPHRGQADPFRSLPGLVHPHAPEPQEDLLYVSDSCRAWRDRSLLGALDTDGPRRLLLNTHPELWLDASVESSLEYLESVVLAIGVERAQAAYDDEATAWRGHHTANQRA